MIRRPFGGNQLTGTPPFGGGEHLNENILNDSYQLVPCTNHRNVIEDARQLSANISRAMITRQASSLHAISHRTVDADKEVRLEHRTLSCPRVLGHGARLYPWNVGACGAFAIKRGAALVLLLHIAFSRHQFSSRFLMPFW